MIHESRHHDISQDKLKKSNYQKKIDHPKRIETSVENILNKMALIYTYSDINVWHKVSD